MYYYVVGVVGCNVRNKKNAREPPMRNTSFVMKRVRAWVQDYKLFGDKKEVQSVSETRWKLLGENALKINI